MNAFIPMAGLARTVFEILTEEIEAEGWEGKHTLYDLENAAVFIAQLIENRELKPESPGIVPSLIEAWETVGRETSDQVFIRGFNAGLFEAAQQLRRCQKWGSL